MRKALLLLLGFLLCTSAMAQDIATDSKGKSVFPFLSARKSRVEFGSKDFSFNLQGKVTKWRFFRKAIAASDARLVRDNVMKSSFQFYQFSALNVVDLASTASVGTIRPGGRIRAGYQRIVDSIHVSYTGWTYTIGLSANLGKDNLKVYDLQNASGVKRYPLIGGADFNLTLFPPWHDRSLITINASYSNGYNDTELLNFKELGSAGISMIGTAFERFDGKFGDYRTSVNSGRLSVGFPTIFNGRVSPVPYTAVVIRDSSVPVFFVGGFLNLFAEPVEFRKLSASNTFGIGVDWNKGAGNWSTPIWFVRGNIAFMKA